MSLTKDERQLIQDTHDAGIEVKTVLLGANGDDGLVGEVKHIAKSHYKLRLCFWLLVSSLLASGVISAKVLGVFHFNQ